MVRGDDCLRTTVGPLVDTCQRTYHYAGINGAYYDGPPNLIRVCRTFENELLVTVLAAFLAAATLRERPFAEPDVVVRVVNGMNCEGRGGHYVPQGPIASTSQPLRRARLPNGLNDPSRRLKKEKRKSKVESWLPLSIRRLTRSGTDLGPR